MPKTPPRILLPAIAVLAAHVFLPLSLLDQLGRASIDGRLAWLAALFLAASYVAFIVIAGSWSWVGGVVRFLLPGLLLAAAWTSRPRVFGSAVPPALTADVLMRLALGGLFGVLAILALRGRRLRESALELGFPLRGGTFIVGQGGASRLVNYHYAHPCQRYALDILMVNRAGLRARGLYPMRPDRYAIWGAEVVSPCDGVVAAAVDGLPDHRPPDRDPVNRAGNHVALEHEGTTIYLAHLMQGSLLVRAGDRVRAGQPLGRVGNSGNTTEPHLHIHAEQGAWPGRFSGMPGVPIRFGGRFLVRNDRVRAL